MTSATHTARKINRACGLDYYYMGRHLNDFIVIAAGGIIGAFVRVGFSALIEPRFILAILSCNIAGSFLYALYANCERTSHPHIRKFHTVGFCGSLTTFSAFVVQVILLCKGGEIALATAYFFGTFCACIAAAATTIPLAKMFAKTKLKEAK